jgi:hypothetical protein
MPANSHLRRQCLISRPLILSTSDYSRPALIAGKMPAFRLSDYLSFYFVYAGKSLTCNTYFGIPNLSFRTPQRCFLRSTPRAGAGIICLKARAHRSGPSIFYLKARAHRSGACFSHTGACPHRAGGRSPLNEFCVHLNEFCAHRNKFCAHQVLFCKVSI